MSICVTFELYVQSWSKTIRYIILFEEYVTKNVLASGKFQDYYRYKRWNVFVERKTCKQHVVSVVSLNSFTFLYEKIYCV